MCNYNMADTLDRSLRSILCQLDDNFEVVLVDDGSDDDSVKVIKELQEEFANLILIELKRDKKRKLGLTRNISIQKARGDFVLLQLDCDDVYEPYIKSFTEVFDQIERSLCRDLYLKGEKINMGRREFLLKHGPYRNLFRGEDRDMWKRLASVGAFIRIKHNPFFTRLEKSRSERIRRLIYHSWDHLTNNYRQGTTLPSFLIKQLSYKTNIAIRYRLLNLFFAIPTRVNAYFSPKLETICHEEINFNFTEYLTENSGTFSEVMKKNATEIDWTKFSSKEKSLYI